VPRTLCGKFVLNDIEETGKEAYTYVHIQVYVGTRKIRTVLLPATKLHLENCTIRVCFLKITYLLVKLSFRNKPTVTGCARLFEMTPNHSVLGWFGEPRNTMSNGPRSG
jgi:hypothetical protein